MQSTTFYMWQIMAYAIIWIAVGYAVARLTAPKHLSIKELLLHAYRRKEQEICVQGNISPTQRAEYLLALDKRYQTILKESNLEEIEKFLTE